MNKKTLILVLAAAAASVPRGARAQVAVEKPVMAISIRLEKDSAPVEIPRRFKDRLAAAVARGSYRPIAVKESRFTENLREQVVAEDGAVFTDPDRLNVWISVQTGAGMDGSTRASVKSVTLETVTSRGVMGGHELERKIVPSGGFMKCSLGQSPSDCVAEILDGVQSEIESRLAVMSRTTFLWAKSDELFKAKENMELGAFKSRSQTYEAEMAQMREFSDLLKVEQSEYHR